MEPGAGGPGRLIEELVPKLEETAQSFRTWPKHRRRVDEIHDVMGQLDKVTQQNAAAAQRLAATAQEMFSQVSEFNRLVTHF